MKVRYRSFLTTSVLLLLSLGATPQTSRRSTVVLGPAEGMLQLPEGGQDGTMLGALNDVTGSSAIYGFSARLVEQGVACPACFAGLIEGVLDDGIGPGPDFVVNGFYTGAVFDGTGTFEAVILRPGGAFAGRIRGRLADPPDSTQPGVWRGIWRLRH